MKKIFALFFLTLALVSCNNINNDILVDTKYRELLSVETELTSITTVSNPIPEVFPDSVTVPVLMFHDVKTYEGGTWSMSAENFRNTIKFLIKSGFTPISFDELIDYVDGISGIPEKPVCITLDDGYYSNYINVLPIVTDLEIPVTIFMSCKTVREEEIPDDYNENTLYKMSIEELETMQSSPYVEIQSHTYGLHGVNRSYSDVDRSNSLPLDSESKDEYKEIFAKDCELAEGVLLMAGVEENKVFSYPSGKYHKWTEEVLRERNYRVSLTTDYNHRNIVKKGKSETLFLLGRMNVNDDTTEEQLHRYLERK